MGAGQTNPPFEPLVALVCNLIRYSLTPEMIKEERFWNKVSNPPPKTLLGFDLDRDVEAPLRYPLSQMAF